MATTSGIVQRLTVIPGAATACVWIGPTPTNTELLFVLRDSSDTAATGAFEASMVDALIAAAVSRREVVAIHADTDGQITSVQLSPT